ncbi:MAG: putative GHMP kinase [candidate division NC10 bacterium]|nr:putative GHMP kinase [candidate division NC10 bacterium]
MGDLIVASAPTRIDFAGGTLDIPPLHLFHQPAITVNVAIDLAAEVHVRRRAGRSIRLFAVDQQRQLLWPSRERISWTREPFLELVARLIRSLAPDTGLDIWTDCHAPAGAGTGGSSALAVATAAALAAVTGRRLDRPTLIEQARSIETQAIHVPTGYQDYYAAAYGGASAIEFGLTGIRRTPVGTKAFLEQLERHLLLVYLGKPRFSGANNWELFKRHIEGDRKTVALFEALKENAISMRNAFLKQDVARIADLLNRDWEIRRRALPAMSSPAIDRLIRALRRAGAIGARVCGAGGGGCLALLIEPKARVRLGEIAASAGARTLPCSINMRGLVVRRVKH